MAERVAAGGRERLGDRSPEPSRLAVVGLSVNRFCGVYDHATLLAAELERRDVACSLHWLARQQSGLGASRREVGAWTRRLAGELRASGAEAVLLHYSVFSYCYRGVPIFVGPILRAIERAGVRRLIVVGHELAYPWHHAGLRGKVWATVQRPALRSLVSRAAGVIVTADFRAEWLRSRRWLPQRTVLMAPVFSNLPAPRAGAEVRERTVGMFGYAYGGVAVESALDAIARLDGAQLRLLGAPGRDSAAGADWLSAARACGIEAALSFSGELPAQELADELGSCAVLLFADVSGASSRKGSLAGALACGRPVVAIDGPLGWERLVRSGAIRICEPTAAGMSSSLGELLSDRVAADRLGASGRAFAEQEMGVGRTAEAVEQLLAARPAVGSRRAQRLS